MCVCTWHCEILCVLELADSTVGHSSEFTVHLQNVDFLFEHKTIANPMVRSMPRICPCPHPLVHVPSCSTDLTPNQLGTYFETHYLPRGCWPPPQYNHVNGCWHFQPSCSKEAPALMHVCSTHFIAVAFALLLCTLAHEFKMSSFC